MTPLISIYPNGVSYLRETKDENHLTHIVKTLPSAKHFILAPNGDIGVAVLSQDMNSVDHVAMSALADTARQLFLLADLKLTKQ